MLIWTLVRVQVATTQKVTFDHIILSSTLPTSFLCISIIIAPCSHQLRVNFAQSVQSHQKCILHIKHMSILDATYMETLTKAWGTLICDCMSISAKWPLVRVQVTTYTKSKIDLPGSLSITFWACWCKNSKNHASFGHSNHLSSHFRVRIFQIAYLIHKCDFNWAHIAPKCQARTRECYSMFKYHIQQSGHLYAYKWDQLIKYTLWAYR